MVAEINPFVGARQDLSLSVSVHSVTDGSLAKVRRWIRTGMKSAKLEHALQAQILPRRPDSNLLSEHGVTNNPCSVSC